MTSTTRPILCIIAGLNGAGKTTTTNQLLRHEWTEESVYINPDNIAQEQFGDWNAPEAVRRAAEVATAMRYDGLRNHQDLSSPKRCSPQRRSSIS